MDYYRYIGEKKNPNSLGTTIKINPRKNNIVY